MKFIDVAIAFDEIEKESSRTKITQLLAELLKHATPNEAAIISYLSLGSLNPPYVGTQFNLASKSLIKVVAKLIDKSEPTITREIAKLGDLGLVLQQEEGFGKNTCDYTINDINKELNNLLDISGIGSQDVKEKAVFDLLSNLDAASAKYIIRIILGKLRMGFSDMTLLDAFSWMECGDKSIRCNLEEAYNICVDIGQIIKVLKEDGVNGIKKLNITPGIPIRPAAAERLEDAESIFKKLGVCVAQPKLDGFRLQVHVDNTQKPHLVRFFSRNLIDMSHMFPDLAHVLLELKVENIVFEGEAIAYDAETGNFLPFQATVKRKRKHDIESVLHDYPLKLYVFDLLYLNGKSYLGKTHKQRRKDFLDVLEQKTVEKHQVVLPIEEQKVESSKDLSEYFEKNISSGLEGIVVKRTDAVYQAGKRNFNWIKLKRQESGSLNDTVDCVILGYYSGHGKRASFGIGALLVGVYNKEKDIFQTVAKIGTGLTDVEWKYQKKECDKIKTHDKSHNVECAKELFPDVWVDPEIVCMIRADEITLSPLHTAGKTSKQSGYALRFPRLIGYRPDKKAAEATEVTELEHLYKLQFKKSKKAVSKEKQASIFE
ncbi:MAG: putative DNA ligase [candidate division TM6 bacterium GW2011_GWF2_37_49]|nr:MAG: putative DNA ligase [candidate division TM6 bacterium GW2011_GWF2_37_49]